MNEMLPIAKVITQMAAGWGVSHVVKNVISNNTVATSTFSAAKIWVGSIVLGSIAADAGMKHVETSFDQVVDFFKKSKVKLSIVPDEVS